MVLYIAVNGKDVADTIKNLQQLTNDLIFESEVYPDRQTLNGAGGFVRQTDGAYFESDYQFDPDKNYPSLAKLWK